MSKAAFDELIHAPLRLQICAMLAPVQSLPFADIRDSLEISDSVLSKHLSALSDAGYVEVSRVRANSRSRRQVKLTKPGRIALDGHLAALQAVVAAAQPVTLASDLAPEPANIKSPVPTLAWTLTPRRQPGSAEISFTQQQQAHR